MLFNPRHEERFGGLEERLRRADALTPDLMSDVIAETCRRLSTHNPTARAKIDRLIVRIAPERVTGMESGRPWDVTG